MKLLFCPLTYNMKMRKNYWLLFIMISISSCKGQDHTAPIKSKESDTVLAFTSTLNLVKIDTIHIDNAPFGIVRTITQDKAGNIWFATFEGIFKYDGNSFTNISKEVSQARFFSVLEDSKNNLWFGTIGEGLYYYNGESFRNFTTDDGLLNNEIVCIYEDRAGNIWLGTNGGMSMYDGKNFQNYVIVGDTIVKDNKGTIIPNLQRPINEVNAIIEDKTGKFWFGTRGSMFTYDRNSFTTVRHIGKPFNNVRSIIKDKKGNIWWGGNDGFWHYDYVTLTNYEKRFTGYIHEDTEGNIWTSSADGFTWSLSRYDLTDSHEVSKTATEIKSGEGMFFGIHEDSKGNIWSGTLDGVCRYEEGMFTYFSSLTN